MDNYSNDICIVIHGLSDFVNFQKNAWSSYINNIIFSAWVGEEEKYDKMDNVIFNYHPIDSGVGNLNRQKISICSGIEYAKNKNYKRVLKWRSDQVPTNPDLFLKNMSTEKFNVFLYHLHEDGYFADYFMCGSVDSMEKVWSFDGLSPCRYAEYVITKNILKFCINDIFLYKDTINENNNIFSYKWNVDLYSLWKKEPSFLKTKEEIDLIIRKDHVFNDKD